MSSTQMSNELATLIPSAGMVDMKLDVEVMPVSVVGAPPDCWQNGSGHASSPP